MKNLYFITLLLAYLPIFSQGYTTYFTGNTNDTITNPHGGICLMGGATENDEAMKWFLNRADGGDILVLRTSGSDGYNNYMYSQLGVNVNSVETIVFNNANASNDNYIHQKIQNAEAIWFAGGDQWEYISYWRNTPIDSLINLGISSRGLVIGGTSAGMAIQGKYYFSAQNGTITSNDALNNPFHNNLTVDSSQFISNPFMHNVITDTHYDNPDRKGRHSTFLARILQDWGIRAHGIACEEYTSICIDQNGQAKVYGDHPNYDDFAYFISINCNISDPSPEVCQSNTPLTWDFSDSILKVYVVPGTMTGTNSFDLTNWENGVGGNWENWSINQGVLSGISSTPPNCNLDLNKIESSTPNISIYPNPTSNFIRIEFDEAYEYSLYSNDQKLIKKGVNESVISFKNISPGIYNMIFKTEKNILMKKIVIR